MSNFCSPLPWLAQIDHALARPHLEKLLLGRHKFYHFPLCYRDRLSSFVKGCALDAGSHPSCYRDGAVKNILSDHLSAPGNRTLQLYKLFTAQLIEQLFLRASNLPPTG